MSRPRVRELLLQAIERNGACLVAASAGAGKTSALVDACQNIAGHVAWLTVDTPDVAPGRLLTYLAESLARSVPTAPGVVATALGSGAPHVEVAGLLAEAIGDAPTVIVLDELERLGRSRRAWEVIEAIIRYAPPHTSVTLSSREDPPAHVMALLGSSGAAYVDDTDLGFTEEEAAQALVQSGRADVDVPAVVSATGGWVTGVLFHDAESSAEGRRPDVLREYLAAHVIGRLPPDLQEFVITTSVLGHVTAERAAVFGYPDAGALLALLRPRHLPVIWDRQGERMIWHSALREYLIRRLDERPRHESRAVRICHARLLQREGLHEEAVEGFLEAGEVEEAVPSACRAIVRIVRRLDFTVAERWLEAFGDHHEPQLTVARLLIALAGDDISSAGAICDRARERGPQHNPSDEADQAAFLMAWCYLHLGRWDDVEAVLQRMTPGPAPDAVRFAIPSLGDPNNLAPPPCQPPKVNGVAEVMINIGQFGRGLFIEMSGSSQAGWDVMTRQPYRLAALRALGHTEEAMREYRSVEGTSVGRVALLTFVGPELLMDAGAYEEAEALIAEAIRLAGASGSLIFQGQARLTEAKFHLKVRNDPATALASLEAPELQRSVAAFRRMFELASTWRGLALLREQRDAEAIEVLRAGVESMMRDDRIGDLPTAAVYLAEAEWRAGNEIASDRAADLALESASRQGSNHTLLQAIEDFPAVLTRRLDAEASSLSPWHELGRAYRARTQPGVTSSNASIELKEFGRRALYVDGSEVKLPIGKCYELLAYLLTRQGLSVYRESLLGALFNDRRDASSRSYLRQTIRWLKAALPEGVLEVDAETVTLVEGAHVTSDATELTRRLTESAALQGVQRLERTLEALSICESGEYLPGVRSTWADERERELTDAITEARAQVAVIAVDAARLGVAVELGRQVLLEDPGRESAWQVLMRAAEAIGDQDGVTRAFRECEHALAGHGMSPSPTTRSLLEQLRR